MTVFRIEQVWAFLATDDDGTEGIVSILRGSHWMPLIAADERRLTDLTPLVEKIVNQTGQRIELVKFRWRERIKFFDKNEKTEKDERR